MTFLDDPVAGKNEQAARAASMLSASVAMFRTMRDGHLKPDLYHTKPHKSDTPTFEKVVRFVPEAVSWFAGFAVGAYALDMSQYNRLFQSTRIPERGTDRLQSYPASRHVVVQRGADFYALDVLDGKGEAVARPLLQAQLAAILAAPPSANPPLGALTTLPRDTWAQARQALVQRSGLNATALELVDSALFAICLDDSAPTTLNEQSRCMLHGLRRCCCCCCYLLLLLLFLLLLLLLRSCKSSAAHADVR
jgi:carnitine O-palmitoyltransferase 2